MNRTRIAIAACVASTVTGSVAVTSSAATNRFYASLTGAQEVPSKGDPDGTAQATLTVSGRRGLCYDIRPGGLYLNVHTKTYASGAARGQLTTKKP